MDQKSLIISLSVWTQYSLMSWGEAPGPTVVKLYPKTLGFVVLWHSELQYFIMLPDVIIALFFSCKLSEASLSATVFTFMRLCQLLKVYLFCFTLWALSSLVSLTLLALTDCQVLYFKVIFYINVLCIFKLLSVCSLSVWLVLLRMFAALQAKQLLFMLMLKIAINYS